MSAFHPFPSIRGRTSEFDPLRTLAPARHNSSVKRVFFILAVMLGSAVFWAAWLGVTAAAALMHGDCGTLTSQAELASCATEKRWLVWIAIVFGAVLWGAALIGLVKKPWPKS